MVFVIDHLYEMKIKICKDQAPAITFISSPSFQIISKIQLSEHY